MIQPMSVARTGRVAGLEVGLERGLLGDLDRKPPARARAPLGRPVVPEV